MRRKPPRRRRPPARRAAVPRRERRRAFRFWTRSLLALGLCLAALWAMNHQLRPIITSMALSQVNNLTMEIIGATISRTVAENAMDCDAIILMEKDNDGKITALRTNMQAVNRLRSQITGSVLAQIDDLSDQEIGIPIGSLTGIDLFSARGPMLWIRVLSVSAIHSSMRDSFISAGINQTRYCVILSVDTELAVLLPGYTAHTTVHNEVIAAEAIIVGSVPNSYTYFSQFDTVEDAVDYFNDYGPGQNDRD